MHFMSSSSILMLLNKSDFQPTLLFSSGNKFTNPSVVGETIQRKVLYIACRVQLILFDNKQYSILSLE